MDFSATQKQVDKEGSQLCLEYYTPIWGEAPAGREWWMSPNTTLTEVGWCECLEVPCLWLFRGINGTNLAKLLTIVDDLLFSEQDGISVTDNTLALLRDKYGEVSFEREPTSFAGMKEERDRASRTLTVSMPQKIDELFHLHAPLKNSGTTLPASAVGHRGHRRDGMKLTKDQKRVQEVIGAHKFPERIMPTLMLVLHCLSSVMPEPPPEANAV